MEHRANRLPFSRPFIGEEEISAVAEVLRSGWITSGPKTKEFEQRFAALTGAGNAVSVTSATGGLHILLDALDIGPGDEVIMPTLTFASDPNMVELAGAMPVFCDIAPETLLSTPKHIADKLTCRTKAVIVVHYAGIPVDLDGIKAVMADSNAVLIEDAAHATGTYYKGRHIGATGDPAIFSFHPIKNITTIEGGMVTTGDAALAEKLRRARFHGIDREAWKQDGKRVTTGYDMQEPGYKYNMTDVQSAIGLVQLTKLEAMNSRRREIVECYRAAFAGLKGILLQASPCYEHVNSRHLAIAMVENRERFAGRLLQDFNIDTGLHFPLCHRLSYYEKTYGVKRLTGADAVGDSIITLPLFPSMTAEDVAYVITAVQKVLL